MYIEANKKVGIEITYDQSMIWN